MHVWHLTPDASRSTNRVSAGEPVWLEIGTGPIEPGQTVWSTVDVERSSRPVGETRVDAALERNDGGPLCTRRRDAAGVAPADVAISAIGDVLEYDLLALLCAVTVARIPIEFVFQPNGSAASMT